jgi:hypothetical protein
MAPKGKKNGARKQMRAPRGKQSIPPAVPGEGKIVAITRANNVGALSFSAADKAWAWNITLGDMPNSSEFTSLFKYYRPRRLRYEFQLAATSSGGYNPIVYTGLVSPGATVTTLADLTQFKFKRSVLTNTSPIHTHVVQWPTSEITEASGSGRGVLPGQWISTSSTTDAFLGIFAFIVNGNTTAAPIVTFMELVEWEFCGVK